MNPLDSPTAHRAILDEKVQTKIQEQVETGSREYTLVKKESEERI